MFDLFTEILFVTGFVHLVVLTESRFSALRPEPDIQERDNYQPGRHFSDYFDSFLVI
jgi:hypothetical protein